MSNKIAGIDVLLSVNTGTDQSPTWTVVGGQSGAKLTREASQIDVSAKTDGGNGYGSAIPGLKQWEIELEGFEVLNDTAFNLLETKFESRELIQVELKYPNDAKIYTGYAAITSLEAEYAIDDGVKFSIKLSGNGPLTLTTTP